MNTLRAFLLAVCVALLGPTAHAQDETRGRMVDRVVAIVNDGVVTFQDLEDRFQLMKKNVGGSLSAAQQRALLQQALNTLVDEELVRQYAATKDLKVTDADVDTAIANLEKASNQPAGSYMQFVAPHTASARAQLIHNALLQKIAVREILPRINVSTEEVDRLIKNLMSGVQGTERDVAQIFLAVADEAQEQAQADKIQDIYRQLTEGAPFAGLAKTYSEDGAASSGGELGWFGAGELSPVLEKALADLSTGGITAPVRTPQGWHILKLNGSRASQNAAVSSAPVSEVRVIQLFLPVDTTSTTTIDAQQTAADAELKTYRERLRSLADLEAFLQENNDKPIAKTSGDLGWMTADKLAPELSAALADVKTNRFSEVVRTSQGVHLLYVAGRRAQVSDQMKAWRERITQRLVDARADRQLRRFLRDQRRRAFVDIRL